LKPGSLNLLEPSRPVQTCTQIALPSPQILLLLLLLLVVVVVVVVVVVAVTVTEIRLMEVVILPA
jgi:hypothetical protein